MHITAQGVRAPVSEMTYTVSSSGTLNPYQFSLPRSLCSRLRPDVRDRQTADSAPSFNAPALWGRGHNNQKVTL